jgi:hypothetical protein
VCVTPFFSCLPFLLFFLRLFASLPFVRILSGVILLSSGLIPFPLTLFNISKMIPSRLPFSSRKRFPQIAYCLRKRRRNHEMHGLQSLAGTIWKMTVLKISLHGCVFSFIVSVFECFCFLNPGFPLLVYLCLAVSASSMVWGVNTARIPSQSDSRLSLCVSFFLPLALPTHSCYPKMIYRGILFGKSTLSFTICFILFVCLLFATNECHAMCE